MSCGKRREVAVVSGVVACLERLQGGVGVEDAPRWLSRRQRGVGFSLSLRHVDSCWRDPLMNDRCEDRRAKVTQAHNDGSAQCNLALIAPSFAHPRLHRNHSHPLAFHVTFRDVAFIKHSNKAVSSLCLRTNVLSFLLCFSLSKCRNRTMPAPLHLTWALTRASILASIPVSHSSPVRPPHTSNPLSTTIHKS